MRTGRRLARKFYDRDVTEVARGLLGCLLRHTTGNGAASGMIVETEAYLGTGDEASHARFGRTPRCSIMFGPPGFAYVYFIYGMHYMFNVVAEHEHLAGAVLLRALEPVEGLDLMRERRGGSPDLTNGPARLCQALDIDLADNGADLTAGTLGIWERMAYGDNEVMVTPRIGVIGSKEEPYRYLVKDNPYVSR